MDHNNPVEVEYNKFVELDQKTRGIYNKTSKKTIDLLLSLNNIKKSNDVLFNKNTPNEKSQLPADILDILDEELKDVNAIGDYLQSDMDRMGNKRVNEKTMENECNI